MADRKISDLTALTAPASGDYLPIVDISEAAAANKNKRITIEELFRGIPLGTAAAPSIAIEGDENTGIYSPGADQLAISTNGTGRLFVDASGNVGLGTTPVAPFDVKVATDARLLFQDGNTANNVKLNAVNNAVSANTNLEIASANTLFFNGGSERLRITSTGTVNIVGAGTAGSTQAISFNGSAPVNSLVVDSSGRVGIGTSAPASALDVSDGSVVNTQSPKVYFCSENGADRVACEIRQGRYNRDVLVVSSNQSLSANLFNAIENGTSRFVITGAGNVGIGVTSPNVAAGGGLHIDNATSPRIHLTNSTTGSTTGDGAELHVTNSDLWLENKETANIILYNAGGEAARIDSSRRLLVGTSTSRATHGSSLSSAFQVEGTTYNTSSISVIRNQGGFGAGITLAGTGGTTLGSVTAVSNNNSLGGISFQGSDGTNLIEAASIGALVDGTPGANDMPGRLVFSTTADGASSPTERMRITQAGHVGIGKTSTKYKLDASEARIGTGCVVYSANTTKTASTTHTATITFESQGSAWEPKYVEIMFAGSSGTQSTAYAGMARYMFTTITSMGTVTELEDSGNGVSFAATTSGMDLIITATTTANNSYIGFSARITCGGSGNGFPTGMVIA